MRAGRGSSDAYLEDWRRETEMVDGDLEKLVDERVASLQSMFHDEFLERVVKAGGLIDNEKADNENAKMTHTVISSEAKKSSSALTSRLS